VQAADDLGTGEWLFFAELTTECHQTRHFGFSQRDFIAAPLSQRYISDFIVSEGRVGFQLRGHEVSFQN
jgi:hypothetical protein